MKRSITFNYILDSKSLSITVLSDAFCLYLQLFIKINMEEERISDKIWNEIDLLESNIEYGRLTIDRNNLISKYSNIFIIALLLANAITAYIDIYMPIIGSIIIAILSFIKDFTKIIIIPESQISKLSTVITDFELKSAELGNLLDDLYFKRKNIEQLNKKVNDIIKDTIPKKQIISDIYGKPNKKRKQKAHKIVRERLNKIQYIEK